MAMNQMFPPLDLSKTGIEYTTKQLYEQRVRNF